MRHSGPDTRLNLISAGMIATRCSEDVSVQLMLFYTIYTNYNHKLLAEVKKPEIPWDKLKEFALKEGPKVLKTKERERMRFWYVYALEQKDQF